MTTAWKNALDGMAHGAARPADRTAPLTGLARSALAAVFGAGLLLAPPATAQEDPCTVSPADIFETVAPSIVEVYAIAINPFLVSGRVAVRSGTGFFYDDDYVVTNYHVVADAYDYNIEVVGEDAWSGVGVVGIDPTLDIAVLGVMNESILGPSIGFADNAPPRIGDTAYAVGYPLGLGKSISAGIVSGVSRVLPRTTSSWLSPYIQTDAAVSSGNSGGPLIDSCGRAIGMITSGIFAEGAENLAFAIPSEVLHPILDELIATGKVTRPWHGLYGQVASPLVHQLLGINEYMLDGARGFLVETVEPGSGADRAGLRGGSWPIRWGNSEILLGGDLIIQVNGVKITSLDVALNVVRTLDIGSQVDLVYLRDGEILRSSVIIEERPLLMGELEVYRR